MAAFLKVRTTGSDPNRVIRKFGKRTPVQSNARTIVSPSLPGSGLPASRAAWASHLMMLCEVGPNSCDGSAGLLPACASSMICWRNSAGYGGLDLGVGDSLFRKDHVPTEEGQLDRLPPSVP